MLTQGQEMLQHFSFTLWIKLEMLKIFNVELSINVSLSVMNTGFVYTRNFRNGVLGPKLGPKISWRMASCLENYSPKNNVE